MAGLGQKRGGQKRELIFIWVQLDCRNRSSFSVWTRSPSMAYRFKLSEPFDEGVRRIGLQQIDRAVGQLQSSEDPASAIHTTRKGLKRIRALLRLVRTGLGEELYCAENVRYRDVGRLLASARDSHVVMETVSKLETEAIGRTKSAFAAARSRLSESSAGSAHAQNSVVAQALSALEEGRAAMAELPIDGGDIDIVWQGLERAYRQGERAFAVAYDTLDNDDIHEWRKRVQYHWRHMALLTAAWPELLEARIATARQLSSLLGEDHDIAVMLATLRAQSGTGIAKHVTGAKAVGRCEVAHLTANQRRLTEAFAVERQAALRRVGKKLGTRLFAESADAFRQRIEVYWASAVAGSEKDE